MQEHIGDKSPGLVTPVRFIQEWTVKRNSGSSCGSHTSGLLFLSIHNENNYLETTEAYLFIAADLYKKLDG